MNYYLLMGQVSLKNIIYEEEYLLFKSHDRIVLIPSDIFYRYQQKYTNVYKYVISNDMQFIKANEVNEQDRDHKFNFLCFKSEYDYISHKQLRGTYNWENYLQLQMFQVNISCNLVDLTISLNPSTSDHFISVCPDKLSDRYFDDAIKQNPAYIHKVPITRVRDFLILNSGIVEGMKYVNQHLPQRGQYFEEYFATNYNICSQTKARYKDILTHIPTYISREKLLALCFFHHITKPLHAFSQLDKELQKKILAIAITEHGGKHLVVPPDVLLSAVAKSQNPETIISNFTSDKYIAFNNLVTKLNLHSCHFCGDLNCRIFEHNCKKCKRLSYVSLCNKHEKCAKSHSNTCDRCTYASKQWTLLYVVAKMLILAKQTQMLPPHAMFIGGSKYLESQANFNNHRHRHLHLHHQF